METLPNDSRRISVYLKGPNTNSWKHFADSDWHSGGDNPPL